MESLRQGEWTRFILTVLAAVLASGIAVPTMFPDGLLNPRPANVVHGDQDAQAKLDALGAENERLRAELQAREKDLAEANARLAEVTARLALLEAQLAAQEARIANLTRQVEALAAEADAPQAETAPSPGVATNAQPTQSVIPQSSVPEEGYITGIEWHKPSSSGVITSQPVIVRTCDSPLTCF